MVHIPYKPLSDSTLKAMTKAEIIELLRIAEHNFFAMEECCNNQYEYGKKLLAGNAKLKELLKNAVEDVEAEPVKHGYWEEITDYGGWGDTHYRCSVCGEYLEDGKPKDNNTDLCPRCGARMDLNSITHDKSILSTSVQIADEN